MLFLLQQNDTNPVNGRIHVKDKTALTYQENIMYTHIILQPLNACSWAFTIALDSPSYSHICQWYSYSSKVMYKTHVRVNQEMTEAVVLLSVTVLVRAS